MRGKLMYFIAVFLCKFNVFLFKRRVHLAKIHKKNFIFTVTVIFDFTVLFYHAALFVFIQNPKCY